MSDNNNAVKCNNGTFIGKESDELIIWKGIPYATQPVGELRWKKALPAADDDGVRAVLQLEVQQAAHDGKIDGFAVKGRNNCDSRSCKDRLLHRISTP